MLVRNEFSKELSWAKDVRLEKFTPAYSTPFGAMFNVDSINILNAIPSDTVDLVITSPPFALTRKKEYGNEPIERYLDWFMPFCRQIHRILKPTGSFVLDIGGSWVPGVPVRSLYHFALAVRLAEDLEFRLAQEFYWYNPARLPTPAEWVTVRRCRVKDAVNMIWWFGKTETPKADNRKVLQPYSESQKTLMKKGYRAKKRPSGHDISPTAFSKDNGGAIPPNLINASQPADELVNMVDSPDFPDFMISSNVIQIANTESNSSYLRACKAWDIKPHPARYPESLIKFFVDFLTDEGDLVIDPFGGSNVTGRVCEIARRRWIASETDRNYIEGSRLRFDASLPPGGRVGQLSLFDDKRS